ncbi:hypothetical protein BKA70DRAFT_1306224 [Coprinopsis sp. MPI-PUGE-AT-0042]|nr:hypothetical protein BKA70DRAFT_1306224 [Coprinopsis sp. MPI-PUGE-AT-0042]
MLSKAYGHVLSLVSATCRAQRTEVALQPRLAALPLWEGLVADPDGHLVDTYLRADITTAAIQSVDPEWISNHHVTMVSLHEGYREASKHQYIVLRIMVPGDSLPFYPALKRERDAEVSLIPQKGTSTPCDRPSQPTTPQKAKDHSSSSPVESSFALKSGDSTASDTSARRMQRKKLLLRFEPTDALGIFDVTVLACILQAAAPLPQLLQRQCFWHSYMIYEVLLKVYGAASVHGNLVLEEVTGEVQPDGKEKRRRKRPVRKRGEWIVSINNRQDLLDGVEEFSAKFEAGLEV